MIIYGVLKQCLLVDKTPIGWNMFAARPGFISVETRPSLPLTTFILVISVPHLERLIPTSWWTDWKCGVPCWEKQLIWFRKTRTTWFPLTILHLNWELLFKFPKDSLLGLPSVKLLGYLWKSVSLKKKKNSYNFCHLKTSVQVMSYSCQIRQVYYT